MSAYFVANYEVTNPESYKGYVDKVLPSLAKHKAEILVADYESQAVEGESKPVTIVLKFESEEALKAWYNDPEYQAILPERLDNTGNGRAVFVKQFVMPS